MKLNRRFFAALLVVCMVLSAMLPAASAAHGDFTYGPANYKDIALSAYARMLQLQSGVIPAANTEGKYGLIRTDGTVVLDYQYDEIVWLGGDLFRAAITTMVDTGHWSYPSSTYGIINSTGQVLIPVEKGSIECENNTISVSYNDDNGTYVRDYYTLDMKPSTEEAFYGTDPRLAAYDYVWYYNSYNLYEVGISQDSDNMWSYNFKYGLLSSDFDVILPCEYDYISFLSSTTYIVNGDQVIDSSGRDIIPAGTYDSIARYRDILHVSKDGKLGAVDFNGNVLVPLGNYSEISGRNSDGYIAAVTYDGEANYFNEPGALSNIVSEVYQNGQLVKTFKDTRIATETYYRDLAFSTSDGSLNGLMTLDGSVVVDAVYSTIYDSDENNNLIVYQRQGDSWWNYTGLITQDGKQIFAPIYEGISALTADRYIVYVYDTENYEYNRGVKTISGEEIIPMKYWYISVDDTNVLELYDGEKTSLVDFSNKVLIPEQDSIDYYSRNYIECYNNGKYSVVTLSNTVLIPSTDSYDILRSPSDQVNADPRYQGFYDNYDKTIMPYIYQKDDGSYATNYVDYNAGKLLATLPGRLSNIDEYGRFVFQTDDDMYGIGTYEGYNVTLDANGGALTVESTLVTGLDDTLARLPSPTRQGYTFVGWYTQASGGDWVNSKTKFTGNSTVYAHWISGNFTDIELNAYYAAPVGWAVEKGITVGTSDDTFSPESTCTQVQIITFLWRAYGQDTSSPQSPVTVDAVYANAVNWAYAKGIISADFKPSAPCTRADTVSYMWKAAGSPTGAAASSFTDVPAEYSAAVNWAVAQGVTSGTSDTAFSPNDTCTRGQIVTFLYRAFA